MFYSAFARLQAFFLNDNKLASVLAGIFTSEILTPKLITSTLQNIISATIQLGAAVASFYILNYLNKKKNERTN